MWRTFALSRCTWSRRASHGLVSIRSSAPYASSMGSRSARRTFRAYPPYARAPRKLPVVLSADEVVLFLESVSSLKSRAALTTAYAAGLRASEVAGLRVADIDSARGVILVRHGKGAKDRNVMLSAQLLGILRAYWRLARPTIYLFPGRDEEHPIDPTVLHAACRSAVKAAGFAQAGDVAHVAP